MNTPLKTEKETMGELKKIINDMTRDILTTFPEERKTLNPHLSCLLSDVGGDAEVDAMTFVYEHCKKIYPPKFFDILYQVETLFSSDEEGSSTEFLPGIDFKLLWKDAALSEKSRAIIWKYLQLVLFTIISGVNDGATFGDSSKMFDSINSDEFRSKLEETISQMHNVFSATTEGTAATNPDDDGGSGGTEFPSGSGSGSGINLDDLPNPKDIHDHVHSMMDGKLGKMAREIAEETAADLNMDMENADTVSDVFSQLIKNPTKLMGLVKNVGTKLDAKMKNGDIKESELMQEATDIMQKMKNMPGMSSIQSMMSKMGMDIGSMAGMAGMGNSKVNTSAMAAQLERNLKAAKQKDRLRAKMVATQLAKSQAAAAAAAAQTNPSLKTVNSVNGVENLVFSKGEKVDRSSVQDQQQQQPSQSQVKKNKKKNKNKK
jgi:hypothetical protein